MGKIKGWKKIIDDEFYNTGGGFDYYLTFYRNENNPLRQIEIWVEADYKGKRNNNIGVNIGTRYENNTDVFDPIQGNYIHT